MFTILHESRREEKGWERPGSIYHVNHVRWMHDRHGGRDPAANSTLVLITPPLITTPDFYIVKKLLNLTGKKLAQNMGPLSPHPPNVHS